MSGLLALARDVDWAKLTLLLVFILIPAGARLVKWLLEQAGLAEPDSTRSERQLAQRAALEERRRRRAEIGRQETEGGELWRRLARGEPAMPKPEEEDDAGEEEEEEEEAEERAEVVRAAPLVTLEKMVSSPRDAALVARPAAGAAPAAATPAPETPAARVHPYLGFAPGDLRRAMIAREILGPPLGLQ